MKIYETKNGIKILENSKPIERQLPSFLTESELTNVRRFHSTITDYQATPLVKLNSLSQRLGIGSIYVKDESKRFSLNAFKVLGGIYAITKIICRKLGMDINKISFTDLKAKEVQGKLKEMVFITATDGNHGKGVAWAARQYGCKSYVYMAKGTTPSRVNAIRNLGAEEVIVTDVNYDDTVRLAAQRANDNNLTLVQDTSWPGYEEIPMWIAQGYTTLASEILDQLKSDGIERPTHLFLQAGVGSFAGSILGYYANVYKGNPPITTIVEPENAACIYKSAYAKDGYPHAVIGEMKTIMAGLSCGEPCPITWGILRDFASYYASCPDFVTAKGMRKLANPYGFDEKIVSGESGAVGLGLLTFLMELDDLAEVRFNLGLNNNSVVLIISTEGDTDPIMYNKVIYDGKCPTPLV